MFLLARPRVGSENRCTGFKSESYSCTVAAERRKSLCSPNNGSHSPTILSQRYQCARWYDPSLGRFISRDPLEYVDGMSLYRAYFVPKSVDPSGNVMFAWREERGVCSDYEKAEVSEAIAYIKARLDDSCWALPRGLKCDCRPNLKDCLLKTFDSELLIRCEPKIKGRDAAATFGGVCKYAKIANKRLRDKGKGYNDDCSPCTDNELAGSFIRIESKAFVPERLPDGDPAHAKRRLYFIGLLLHEALHACVGDHGDSHGRPDAQKLALEFMINCGGGWVGKVQEDIRTEMPGGYTPTTWPK
jgi:RHS repeat-associated protein